MNVSLLSYWSLSLKFELRYQQGEDVFAMDDLGVHVVEVNLNAKLS